MVQLNHGPESPLSQSQASFKNNTSSQIVIGGTSNNVNYPQMAAGPSQQQPPTNTAAAPATYDFVMSNEHSAIQEMP